MIIRNETMEVDLDPCFPRVLEYRTGGHTLLGAEADEPRIELNGQSYAPSEYSVQGEAKGDRASYVVRFAQESANKMLAARRRNQQTAKRRR